MEDIAKKVMVGDWLLYKSDSPENAFPVRVTAAMLSDELVKWADRFEPIRLTDEVLLGNGFTDGNGYLYMKIDDNSYLEYYPHEHRLTRWYEGVDEWQNHSVVKDIVFRCRCWYVHELQQALKMCCVDREVSLQNILTL